jgi:peroxiredoxin
MGTDFTTLPSDLPRPVDDGAAAHLEGQRLPDVALERTDGRLVALGALRGRWVVYLYPRTGRPGVPSPSGWDAIPGARGCTPQSCGFRDHHATLTALATGVLGVSSQTSDDQREARDRLQLPFELLSDPSLRLAEALGLPTFLVDGMQLYGRITLIVDDGLIRKVFYPVFPPDRSAADVLSWLEAGILRYYDFAIDGARVGYVEVDEREDELYTNARMLVGGEPRENPFWLRHEAGRPTRVKMGGSPWSDVPEGAFPTCAYPLVLRSGRSRYRAFIEGTGEIEDRDLHRDGGRVVESRQGTVVRTFGLDGDRVVSISWGEATESRLVGSRSEAVRGTAFADDGRAAGA